MTQLKVHIDGMSCASCVGRAEKAIVAVPGVEQVSVNFATGTAQIEHGTQASAEAIAKALGDAGYPAQTASVILNIEGMSCASCMGRVENALKAAAGVTEASVNLAGETAHVTYLVGATTPAELIEAVKGAGYNAQTRADATKDGRPGPAERKATELADLTRMTLIAALLTVPVFVLEMGSHFVPGMAEWVDQTIGWQASWVLQFVLTTLVLVWPGARFFRIGVPALLRGAPEMNSLVALGTAAAWGFSTVATFAPALLPAATRAVYFEAAAVIVTLILLGRLLEARAKGRTGEAIRKLMSLQAKVARVQRMGRTSELPIEQIVVGDLIEVRPGEMMPTDGEVISGSSYVNEAMISGEPVPVLKTEGSTLVGGTINGNGTLSYKATKVGADTVLAQIIAMVEQAQGAKLPIQDLVNRITAWFVPMVLGLSALTVAVWLAVGPDPALSFALVSGVAVLIVACPCAMGLATPTSIMVGAGRSAQMGVLFRKGDALQALQSTTVVAFDKTGTLTAGQPELTTLHVVEGLTEEHVLAQVAAVEQRSEHPIANAILRATEARGVDVPEVEDMTAIPGYGASGLVEGARVLVGADRLMQREGVDLATWDAKARTLATEGQTPLFVAIDGQIAALIGVSDPIKPGTPEAVAALHDMGVQVVMITGDNRGTAQVIADRLGIHHVVAEVLPDGKVDAVRNLGKNGARVAYVGDGINDAPALAAADVGIAIGTGTDIAIESADVVLTSGDIRGVVNAFDLSRRVMRNIRQNLFWAFAYNTALIPIAAGVLYPVNGMLLSPMLAAGAMSLSSVFVLSNALRLQWVRPPLEPQNKTQQRPIAANAARPAAE